LGERRLREKKYMKGNERERKERARTMAPETIVNGAQSVQFDHRIIDFIIEIQA
jgi:hypothetical protein